MFLISLMSFQVVSYDEDAAVNIKIAGFESLEPFIDKSKVIGY